MHRHFAVTFAFRVEPQCRLSAFVCGKTRWLREKVSAKRILFEIKCIFSCNEIVAENLDRDTPETLLSLMLRIFSCEGNYFSAVELDGCAVPLNMR
jgi:hypothetical protein